MRLIDANALKVQLQREIEMYYNEDSGGIHTAMEALDEIDNAPTVEAEPKWIPVSERLPEELETVLITFTWRGGQYVTTDRYRYMHTFKDPINWINTSQYMGEKVIAWMPMPKPYEVKHEAD